MLGSTARHSFIVLLGLMLIASASAVRAQSMGYAQLAYDGDSATINVQVYNDPTASGSDSLNDVNVSVSGPNGESVPTATITPATLSIPTGGTGQFTITVGPGDLYTLMNLGGMIVQTNMSNTDVFEGVPSQDFVEIDAAGSIPLLGRPFQVILFACLGCIAILAARKHRVNSALLGAIAIALLAAVGIRSSRAHNIATLPKAFDVGIPAALPNACPGAAGTGLTSIVGPKGPVRKPGPGGLYGVTFTYGSMLFNGKIVIQEPASGFAGCGLKDNFNGTKPFRPPGVGLILSTFETKIPATAATPCTLKNTQILQCWDPVGRAWVTFATNNRQQDVSAPPAPQTLTSTVKNNDTGKSAQVPEPFP